MLWHLGGTVLGLALLIYGAERTVKAAVTVATAFGLPMFLIGGTLVAVGSETVSRIEGAGLVAAYLCFLGIWVRSDNRSAPPERHLDRDRSIHLAAGWIAVGFILIAVGGHLLVIHSKALGVTLGVPGYLLGLVTGLGTTVPEIAIASLAIRRGESDIAVETLFGSNVTDPLFSLGMGAVVGGIAVERVAPVTASAGYAIVASLVVVALFYLNGGITGWRPSAVSRCTSRRSCYK